MPTSCVVLSGLPTDSWLVAQAEQQIRVTLIQLPEPGTMNLYAQAGLIQSRFWCRSCWSFCALLTCSGMPQVDQQAARAGSRRLTTCTDISFLRPATVGDIPQARVEGLQPAKSAVGSRAPVRYLDRSCLAWQWATDASGPALARP